MWEMYEDHIECDECGGPGPPPKFMIPPPPRPPSLDYGIINTNCNEEEMALKAASAQSWDSDMCEAIPILDASLYSSQSLQTSAIIAVFSLLLVLVVLISSLFVWKNKRKVQNFLPCKTPTRGPHMNGLPGGHSVTYEDPDAHLGHRPLVMRHHHHNVEMLHHSKGIHYPSGYPMTRSPPFLVSSSPGPDPYRSNDNVYEELGPGRDSDAESEPPLHSDDDFAEDELSLPGERSFNKSISDTASTIPVSTIYHERITASLQPCNSSSSNNNNNNNNGHERNSLLSSSSSSNAQHDATTVTSAATSTSASSTNNNAPSRTAGILSGVLRHTTGRQNNNRKNRHKPPAASSSMDEFNTSAGSEQLVGDMMAGVPMAQNHLYDNRNHNLMSLAYNNNTFHHHSLNNNLNTNTNNNNRAQYYNTLENEVERRNRINNQLHHPASAVATIFRERNIVNHPNRYPQPYYAASNLLSSMRSRTNPRSIDRRRIVPPMDPIEPTYGYAEPIFHEGYLYDSCGRQQQQQSNTVGRNATALVGGPLSYPEYIAPDYTSSAGIMGSYRPSTHQHHHHHHTTTGALGHHHHQHNHQLYSRGSSGGGGGDSSFGSDSGYSHHHSSTPASSIGRGVGGGIRGSGSSGNGSGQNRLTAALNFGWNRRQPKQQQQQKQQPSSAAQLPAPQTSTSTSSSSTSSSACPKDMNVDRSPNNNSDSTQQPSLATTQTATTTTPLTPTTTGCNSTDVVNCNTPAKA
ncbi:nuclear transcription factor Y subunit alpha [Eupeodes corollae]|uniref:nuclear transcription factor Y subunit alpha n=1 Tax=Eupeodes corollae TaxID=290404 RepID=UPI0024908524|nr:nuclear transcription factor Y subunit alpha [Eupeodes corollae]